MNQKYSLFYIVTYEIDDETKLITSVKLTMPNCQTINLELVEDLTYLIQESEFEVTSDDVDPIISEKISEKTIFSGDANAFGYSVPEEEKRDEN